MYHPDTCRRARLARDARFDGKFFIAVTSTGIYCRPICPVTSPKESNVRYFATAVAAAGAGFRPCLRCRPDSAPHSPVWNGVDTTLKRALELIDNGWLQDHNLPALAARLGVGDRYLRRLFQTHIGVSPKAYALYQQCLFAKQLLHQTQLPIHRIAVAAGFNSVRRFNDCFQQQLQLTPTQVRKQPGGDSQVLTLFQHYRPPYLWPQVQRFLAARCINGLDWCDDHSYGRTFHGKSGRGWFTAKHEVDKNRFHIRIALSDLSDLRPVVGQIRRLLDLDVDVTAVDAVLRPCLPDNLAPQAGLRLPGLWSMYEAGVRAVLGQQVSVVAAKKMLATVISELGDQQGEHRYFPTPAALAASDLAFLKMPAARRTTLRTLAQHYVTHPNPDDPQAWLALKGIGPWTVNYAKLRGLSDPDVFMGGDLGVKKVLAEHALRLDTERAAPWRSYLTLHLWSLY